ncbi:YiiG family protein [Pseudomonas avellanae]|uniref:YiiG family protein n=1 Tax=Pseudomonas avellanae TaxID=46257 RepID=UPI00040C284D|nr:YiiG family protein [Pseudomonas avellanae]
MISNRAFITAICVFAAIAWAQHKLANTHRVSTDSIADTSMMKDATACLVFDDTLLLERYADYRKHYQALVDGSQGMLPFIQSFALGGNSRAVAMNESLACSISYPQLLYPKSDPLVIAVIKYSETLDTLRDRTFDAEALYNQPRPDIERARQLDADLAQDMHQLQQRSLAVRKHFEEPQFLARSEQLAAIDYRLGHDQHWHTLNFMLLARQTINYLNRSEANARLSPDDLKALYAELVDAWLDAERYFNTMPNLKSANRKRPVWTVIKAPAHTWLATLDTLQQRWAAHADVDQLNKQLRAVEQGYDQLLMRYNASVSGQY